MVDSQRRQRNNYRAQREKVNPLVGARGTKGFSAFSRSFSVNLKSF